MPTEASIRFDHFAYPVDDLVKAEDFYTMIRVGNRVGGSLSGTKD